jgi:hypothetical protein
VRDAWRGAGAWRLGQFQGFVRGLMCCMVVDNPFTIMNNSGKWTSELMKTGFRLWKHMRAHLYYMALFAQGIRNRRRRIVCVDAVRPPHSLPIPHTPEREGDWMCVCLLVRSCMRTSVRACVYLHGRGCVLCWGL